MTNEMQPKIQLQITKNNNKNKQNYKSTNYKSKKQK